MELFLGTVTGHVTVAEDTDKTREDLLDLLAALEPEQMLGEAELAYYDKLLPGIVGFRLAVRSCTYKEKVSAHRSEADQLGIERTVRERTKRLVRGTSRCSGGCVRMRVRSLAKPEPYVISGSASGVASKLEAAHLPASLPAAISGIAAVRTQQLHSSTDSGHFQSEPRASQVPRR